MDKRPTSITVVSIILIIFGVVALLGVLAWYALKDTPEMQAATAKVPTNTLDFIIGATGSLLMIACAIGFLLRQGWMRFLLLVWVVWIFVYGYARGHLHIVPVVRDVVIYGLTFYFLFTPKARAWFAAKPAA